MMKRVTQRIRYVSTEDGVQLAWAEAGTGPVLIKAANWLSHLEYEWESPVWRHWMRFFSDHFRFMRYDERGCGMTDLNVGNLSLERWVEDLEAGIPGAQFIELDSKNHILLEHEPAWERFCAETLEFLGLKGSTRSEDPAFASLSPRKREALTLITEGIGNAQIAERLSISEKTVRNHVSNLFDKLGVWTRSQAIVFARDRGFRAS
jgi:DNA-binding CsgD family transcriptional regulator